MNYYDWLLSRLYAGLLNFYPGRFRREFGSEMQAVFEQSLVEASGSGQVAVLFLRELRDWPKALLHAHLQERRLKHMAISFDEKPIKWWGVLAGMGLFLLPMIFELLGEISTNTLPVIFRVGLVVSILALILFAIFKGLSRWGLPVLGMVLGVLWMFVGLQFVGPWFVPWLERLVQGGRQAPPYIWQVIMDGVLWIPLLLISMAFVLIFLLLPPLRTLYRRVRNDWTLVSLTLYGAILFALFIDWDEYTQASIFISACYLFLALGVAGYLLSKTKATRIAWLLGGATLSMLTMAVGKFILVPLQDWPVWFQWHAPETERWFESLRSLSELGWILLVLMAPSVINLLPPAREPVVGIPDSPIVEKENSAVSVSPR